MRALVFQIGAERYGLDARLVREVVAAVALRPVPHAPPEVAGLARWRGAVVPVIDLVRLLAGRPCPARMSSRLIVVDYGAGGGRRPLGLLAEHVTDVEPYVLAGATALAVPGAGYLGALVASADPRSPLTQLIDVGALLPPALRAMLGAAAEGAA